MARFFVPQEAIQQNKAVITGPDVKHITRVLRLKPGDTIGLSSGGREFAARITEITKKEGVCEIVSENPVSTEPPVRVTLYQGLPKGDKMELVIQKSTELGVSCLVPVVCERTVIKLDEKKARERQARWQKVAQEAAKQSRRTSIPEVREPLNFDRVLASVKDGTLAVMPWEEETSVGMRQVLRNPGGPVKEVAVFIGPEGGFSAREAGMARDRGVRLVSLGPRILRTETAGIAAAAIIMYELGDLGGGENGS